MRTITTADELDAFAQAHDHGEQVTILHARHAGDGHWREWRIYDLDWERWDEQGGTVTFRPVWETDTGGWLDTDWITPTAPAYILEPATPSDLLSRPGVEDDVIERVADLLGSLPEARNITDITDERTTVIDAPVEHIARTLAEAGLLATHPTLPSREDIARRLFEWDTEEHPEPRPTWADLTVDQEEFERSADAVLALLTGQTETGEQLTRYWQHERTGEVVETGTAFRTKVFSEAPHWREVEVIPLDAEPSEVEIEAAAGSIYESEQFWLRWAALDESDRIQYTETAYAALVAAAEARRAER